MNKKYLKNHRKSNRNKGKKILLYVGGMSFFVLLMTYLLLSFYYNKHFYKNTIINGINASHMTVKQAEEAINAKVQSYSLTLKERNDVSEQIKGDDIALHTVFDTSLSEFLDKQNDFAWPVSLFKTHGLEINTSIEYDETMLKKQFDDLMCFDEANIVEPVNAYISGYGNNGYDIIPEEPGVKVKKDNLYEAIKQSIIVLEPFLSLEKEECYEEAKINSKYSKLVDAVNKMNKIAGAKITYKFGEDVEIVDGKRISEWISVNDDYQVKLDSKGVKEFVDYIGKNYNSFGRVRSFKTSYGDVLQISGGDYGWWLNRSKEVSGLKELILEGKQLLREPDYFQTARQYGQDDIGNTYVEVNLTAQHLFFYKEGSLILETDFVSGNVSKKHGTPTGTYPIQYKKNDAILVGEDYANPVKYWMPFNANIGFHDASWRNSFGKDIYKKNGSHGCVNMPEAAAKTMYKNIERGIAVVVYELAGTESYDVDVVTKKEKEKKKETTPKN